MMRVPRSARPSTMSVEVPREGGYGGEFEQPVEVRRVRFEPVSASTPWATARRAS